MDYHLYRGLSAHRNLWFKYLRRSGVLLVNFEIGFDHGFDAFSLVSMCGGNPRHDAYGFQHWKEGAYSENI